MAVPDWAIEYGVIFILGLIAGLLVRFLILIVAVVVAAVVIIWLLGYIASSLLSSLPTFTGQVVAGLSIGPQLLFTVGALVFIVGLFLGILLTTRLRSLDRPPSS